jgi:hypothetical protein
MVSVDTIPGMGAAGDEGEVDGVNSNIIYLI